MMNHLTTMMLLLQFSLISITKKFASCDATTSSSAPILSLSLIPENEVKKQRLSQEGRRRLQNIQTDALHQGFGTHYVDIWVGLPFPQRQTLMVDTGSSVTAFPCTGCIDCGEQYHTDFLYDFSVSETFHTPTTCNDCKLGGSCPQAGVSDTCNLSMKYLEGSSWNAFECRDMAYFGDGQQQKQEEDSSLAVPTEHENLAFELTFGCQTQVSGQFINQHEDGILGLAKKSEGTLWHQMYQAGKIPARSFSLCYDHHSTPSEIGTNVGVMTLGGFDANLHKSPMVFAKDFGSDLYTVYVEGIYLRSNGGEGAVVEVPAEHTVHKINLNESQLNSNPVIVDSGTTYTFFNEQMKVPFQNMWKQLTGFDYDGRSISLTNDELLSLPTILIQMRADSVTSPDVTNTVNLAGNGNMYSYATSVVVALPAIHYMEYKNEKYTPRIYLDSKGMSILGANTMRGHDVFFDVDNSRIGWAESTCVSDSQIDTPAA